MAPAVKLKSPFLWQGEEIIKSPSPLTGEGWDGGAMFNIQPPPLSSPFQGEEIKKFFAAEFSPTKEYRVRTDMP